MITQAICFVFARAVETAAVAALLMAAAWAARVEKRTWERAAICAALIVGVTWSLAAAGALIPLFGGLLATAVPVPSGIP